MIFAPFPFRSLPMPNFDTLIGCCIFWQVVFQIFFEIFEACWKNSYSNNEIWYSCITDAFQSTWKRENWANISIYLSIIDNFFESCLNFPLTKTQSALHNLLSRQHDALEPVSINTFFNQQSHLKVLTVNPLFVWQTVR